MAADRFKPAEDGPEFTEGQEDRILTMQGPWAKGMRRFKIYVGIALVVLALGNAFTLRVVQESQLKDCRELNVRARANTAVLSKLAEATAKDGDNDQMAVWQEYLETSRRNPLPKC